VLRLQHLDGFALRLGAPHFRLSRVAFYCGGFNVILFRCVPRPDKRSFFGCALA
jgi:hypothetical protein